MAALGVLPLAGNLKQSAALPQRNRLQNRSRVQPPRCSCVVAATATAGPSAQQKIRVKLSSYHSELLTESVDLIRTATESTGPSLFIMLSLGWAAAEIVVHWLVQLIAPHHMHGWARAHGAAYQPVLHATASSILTHDRA